MEYVIEKDVVSGIRKRILQEIFKVIDEYYVEANCGIYNTRNVFGDIMHKVFQNEEEDVYVYICFNHAYFEVFGLNDTEWYITKKYYYGR